MLRAMIRLGWKGSWHYVVAFAMTAFALPIVSVRGGWRGEGDSLPRFLIELQMWGLLYPVLAAVIAVVLAASFWSSDRKGHHIYALLLPVPRSRYVLLRYAAGLVLLMPIALALWLGAVVATASVDMPPGLREYPHALGLKFLLSVVLLFGFAFAIGAASRRALGIGFRLMGLLIAVHVALLLLSPKTNLLWQLAIALSTWPGPFAPIGGRWMLIDA